MPANCKDGKSDMTKTGRRKEHVVKELRSFFSGVKELRGVKGVKTIAC